MRALRAIAGITIQETLKQPTTWVLAVVAAVLMLLLPVLSLFAMAHGAALLKEMGLQTIALATIAITLFGAANVVTRELEQRTLLTLLAKPVTRAQLIAGKYLGLVLLNLALGLLLGTLMLGALVVYHATERPGGSPVWESEFLALERETAEEFGVARDEVETDTFGFLLTVGLRVAWVELGAVAFGIYMALWQMIILAALLVAGSALLAPAANAVLAVVVFLAGHMHDTISLAFAEGEAPAWLAAVLLAPIPNLRLYDIGEVFTREIPLPLELAAWGTLLGALYVTVYLAAGCAILARRDIG